MKKNTLLIAFSIAISNCFGQGNDWSKADRNEIYEEYLTSIKHKDISQEQKESIALCYLDEVTKKFSKTEYQLKIDAEIRKLKESLYIECSKNLALEVKRDAPKTNSQEGVSQGRKVNEGNFTREDIIGTWRNENGKLYFNEDNTFLAKTDKGESIGSTWYINKDKNIIVEEYGTLYVRSFDGKTLKYQQTLKKKVLGVTTKKTNAMFTATKVE